MPSCARRIAIALLAGLLLAACGTRLDHQAILAGAGGGAVKTSDLQGSANPSTQSTVVGSGNTTATTVAAGVAPSSGPAPSASGTATTAPASGGTPSGQGSAGPACPNGPLSPVNIGHLGGYEGLVGTALAGGLETAQVWAKSVNSRGGLNCHPVNLITQNDHNDPNSNATLVRQLVEQDHVIAFVGNLTPLSDGGGLAYLQQKGVPLVGDDLVHPASFTSPIIFTQGSAVDVAGPGAMAAGVATAKAKHLPNPTRTSFWVCEVEACTSAAGKVSAGAARFGYSIVYSPSISLTQTNFTSQCTEAKNQNVGVVFVGGAGATLEAAANSCADQGYHPQFVTYSLAIQNSLAGNPNLEGVVGASPTFPWMLTDGPAAQYAAAFRQFAPGQVTSGSTSAVWTAGKLMEAASQHLPANPTSADVLAGLYALRGDTLGGLAPPLTFVKGQGNPHLDCYFIVQVTNKKWTAPQGATCVKSP